MVDLRWCRAEYGVEIPVDGATLDEKEHVPMEIEKSGRPELKRDHNFSLYALAGSLVMYTEKTAERLVQEKAYVIL